MFFSVTKGIQSINLGAVAVCWVLAISVSCLGLQRHNLSTVQTDRWQYTENWKHPLTHVFSHQNVMFTGQYSLHVKRVRLLFNSPRKSHSYTRHVKWGSEGREGGCRVEGNQEGHSYSIIVSYEVMLELEHRDHTFTSWHGGHNHNVQTHRFSSGEWWQYTLFPILADFTTSY